VVFHPRVSNGYASNLKQKSAPVKRANDWQLAIFLFSDNLHLYLSFSGVV